MTEEPGFKLWESWCTRPIVEAMKLLTLNAHSWLEIHQPAKILATARAIISEGVDVVALQEANQLRDGLKLAHDEAGTGTGAAGSAGVAGAAGSGAIAISCDNYAYLLAEALQQLGHRFTWAWVPAHVGFELYDEGVAILVREGAEFKAAEFRALVMEDEGFEYPIQPGASAPLPIHSYEYDDVRRRVALAVKLVPSEDSGCDDAVRDEARAIASASSESSAWSNGFWLLSGHFSWWDKPGYALFQPEWEAVHAFAEREKGTADVSVAGDVSGATAGASTSAGLPTIVCGDLNAPAANKGQGYDLVRSLGWIDTFAETTDSRGGNTVVAPISGWEGHDEPRRIDYILTNTRAEVLSHSVIFDGEHHPVVSDHYGVIAELKLQ